MRAVRPSIGLDAQTPGGAAASADLYSSEVLDAQTGWARMFTKRPNDSMPLHELEGLVARRMEILAAVDQLANSPKTTSTQQVIEHFAKRLQGERKAYTAGAKAMNGHSAAANPSVTPDEKGAAGLDESPRGHNLTEDDMLCMTPQEDLISHLLCRFAFCVSDKWRSWFIRTEEILLRARMHNHKDSRGFVEGLLSLNKLPCEAVNRATDPNATKLNKFVEWKKVRDVNKGGSDTEYFKVPISVVPRLVKSRDVLCCNGQAYVERKKGVEVFVNIFKYTIARGLNDAWRSRSKLGEDDDEQSNLMAMVDTFLNHFVAEPVDRLQVSQEGAVRAGDIKGLAATHMPLCMRNIDTHTRAKGHLKHHGRFQYGLFLKAIGLSLEDALQLFSSLMTVNGGGSLEAFSKSSYGYNIRHKYGKEGKKTSYSSLSCGTILNMPPMVDGMDCHGCPYRFKDESKLRDALGQAQPNPHNPALPAVRPSASDIEDIVADAKAMHYTRACYKYFMATHEGARHDTLFRSPYEYYQVSREQEVKEVKGEEVKEATVGTKRTLFGAAIQS